jgi:predicted nucleotidyltransferase
MVGSMKDAEGGRRLEIVKHLVSAIEGEPVPGVVSVYLFGSYAEDRAHRESDVDVGVLLRYDAYRTARDRFDVRLRLGAELSAACGREIDVVVLNDAPPHLARRIVLDGRRIFCTDGQRDHAFARDVQLRAADLEPFLRRTRRTKLQALRQ